ncbi:hypothetical protein EUX98_g4325 [Antrodiella citrinella]|uniref:Uncharacterized protein n=1 Tax=Antrodiella citrinella TaxID=2447956 RepID=A0A4S4MU88_9APHY|nr:hypothetical protein EUX98_g4325 [Antrodiella citrinella]
MQLVNGAYRPEPQPNPDSESSQVQAQEAFHVWAEKQMEMEMPLWALGQTAAMNSEEVRKTMMDHMRVMVDSVEIIGFKPDGDGSGSADADTDVVFIPIPNNKYTIRMWVHKHGHGAPWERFFTLDFFDTATNMPVNSPFKQYALWGDNVLWHSLRPAYIADKSVVPPGRENFIVKEGANIKFARPGKMDIVFQARIPNVPATADEGTEAAKGNITGNDGVAKEEEAEWDEAWERIWNPRPNAVYSDEDDEDDDEGAEEDEYEDALMEEMEYVYQQAREILGPGEKLSKEDKAMLLEETRQNFQEEGKRQRRIEKYEST